jgi:hypothetical protein
MRLKCALLCYLIAVTSVAAAQEKTDGNWWRELTQPLKALYLAGYTDGHAEAATSGVNDLDIMALTSNKKEKVCAPYLAAVRGALAGSSVGGIKLGTMADGLDSFYGDYRNRSIRVAHAVPFVVRAIRGESDESLRPSIEAARKLATYERALL